MVSVPVVEDSLLHATRCGTCLMKWALSGVGFLHGVEVEHQEIHCPPRFAIFFPYYHVVAACKYVCMSVTGSLFFSRFCRRYGRSPHFLDLSCCLYNRLTAGLLMCAIRVDHMKYSRKFVFYNFCLECTRIPGTGIHVLALCVFLLEAFPRSLFCRGAKENKDWWSRHIIALCNCMVFNEGRLLLWFLCRDIHLS